MLLALAQGVANATAALVLKAKNIASQSPDTKAQSKMITAAKETARTTSQLVACVKVVVPSITSHMCQEQVVEAAKLVATAVDDTESACKVSEFASVTNIYLLLTLSIVDQKKRLLSNDHLRENSLVFYRNLSCISLRKCLEISLFW